MTDDKMTVGVTVNVTIGEIEHKLTISEAKKLYATLGLVVGSKHTMLNDLLAMNKPCQPTPYKPLEVWCRLNEGGGV